MKKNKIVEIFFLIWAATQVPPPQKIFPEYVFPPQQEPDRIYSYLSERRWDCSGDGCLNDGDIERLSTRIREHSERAGLSPAMIVGIIMVENPWLDSVAVSYAGAIGIMQVMPLHTGNWDECSSPLESISGSVCYGVEILSDLLRRRDSERSALLGYNGCVSSPSCIEYPEKVAKYAQFLVEDY